MKRVVFSQIVVFRFISAWSNFLSSTSHCLSFQVLNTAGGFRPTF